MRSHDISSSQTRERSVMGGKSVIFAIDRHVSASTFYLLAVFIDNDISYERNKI